MPIDWSALVRDMSKPEYPLVEVTESRIQVIVAAPELQRYCMAIRNTVYGHWNIYVLVSAKNTVMLETLPGINVDYAAPAGRGVTWMGPTQRGKLSIPLQIGSDSEGDFWVGYSIPRSSELDAKALVTHLLAYESVIRTAERDHCTVSG